MFNLLGEVSIPIRHASFNIIATACSNGHVNSLISKVPVLFHPPMSWWAQYDIPTPFQRCLSHIIHQCLGGHSMIFPHHFKGACPISSTNVLVGTVWYSHTISKVPVPFHPPMSWCAQYDTVKGQIFAVVLISLCSRSMIFPRNLNHHDKFTTLLTIVICCYMHISKFKIRELKTTVKGPHQENREILTPLN